MNIPEMVSKLQSAIDLDDDMVTGRVYGARLNSERAAAILAAEMPRWVPCAEKLPEVRKQVFLASTMFWKSEKNRFDCREIGVWDGTRWCDSLFRPIDPERQKITYWCDFPALPSPPKERA